MSLGCEEEVQVARSSWGAGAESWGKGWEVGPPGAVPTSGFRHCGCMRATAA